MKRIILLLLFPVLLSAQSKTETKNNVKWHYNYDSAIKKASKSKKNVLVYFTGSDWCPPCKKLKVDLFETTSFKNLATDFVLLYIDLPRNKSAISDKQYRHNKDLLSKYNKRGVFPLLVVLNAKGKALDEHSGYSMTGDVSYHINFLEKNK